MCRKSTKLMVAMGGGRLAANCSRDRRVGHFSWTTAFWCAGRVPEACCLGKGADMAILGAVPVLFFATHSPWLKRCATEIPLLFKGVVLVRVWGSQQVDPRRKACLTLVFHCVVVVSVCLCLFVCVCCCWYVRGDRVFGVCIVCAVSVCVYVMRVSVFVQHEHESHI